MVGHQIARFRFVAGSRFFGGRFGHGLRPLGFGCRLVVTVQEALDRRLGRFGLDFGRQVLCHHFDHFFGGLEHLGGRVGSGDKDDRRFSATIKLMPTFFRGEG